MIYDPKLAFGAPSELGGVAAASAAQLTSEASEPAVARLGVDGYWVQLTEAEITARGPQGFAGGLWRKIDRLQLEKLRSEDPLPHRRLRVDGGVELAGRIVEDPAVVRAPDSQAPAASMMGVNGYWIQLSEAELAARGHRDFVGGMWEEIGRLQFEKLRAEGLLPHHRLLDVGCGALRGGVHFARFLQPGNYHGIDINPSLLEGGRRELASAGLDDRDVRLAVTDRFDATGFGVTFDFGISVSLLTHLTANHIILCFDAVRRVMHAESRFFFTFFEAPHVAHVDAVEQRAGIYTFYTQDCFHYAVAEMDAFARLAGLECVYHGDWGHPRNQKLVEVRLPRSGKDSAIRSE